MRVKKKSEQVKRNERSLVFKLVSYKARGKTVSVSVARLNLVWWDWFGLKKAVGSVLMLK